MHAFPLYLLIRLSFKEKVMENTTNAINAFFTESPQGKCTDNTFEVGNLYRKTFACAFCVNGNCHYRDQCDRRELLKVRK